MQAQFDNRNAKYGSVHIAVSSIRRNCIIRREFSAKRHSARDWLVLRTGSRRPKTVQNRFVAVRCSSVRAQVNADRRNETKRNEMNCNELKRNEIDSVRCVAVHFVSFRFVRKPFLRCALTCDSVARRCAPFRVSSRRISVLNMSGISRNSLQQLDLVGADSANEREVGRRRHHHFWLLTI